MPKLRAIGTRFRAWYSRAAGFIVAWSIIGVAVLAGILCGAVFGALNGAIDALQHRPPRWKSKGPRPVMPPSPLDGPALN
jgi:hypothetical protein